MRHRWNVSLLLTCLSIFSHSLLAQSSNTQTHPKSDLNCKTCHSCDYPTVQSPCLRDCPREDLITIRHSAASGPVSIILDRFKDRYGSVVFSHRLHAEMADMGGGCESCHHYNTEGPVLSCGSCHEPGSANELGKPGLIAAYHRQCISCHREWQRTVECRSCHELADIKQAVKRLDANKTKAHKKVERPVRILYDTKTNEGTRVTFYHDQHARTFDISCASCHQNQGCATCHDVTKKASFERTRRSSDAMTEDEKHEKCFTCHKNDGCTPCHSDREAKPFDHTAHTGWAIKGYHRSVSCRSCHGEGNRFTRVNRDCQSCHQLEKRGSFRHEVTGLRLDDNHNGLSCVSCHPGKAYTRSPDCTKCHDDETSWPKDSPGKRWP